MNSTSSTPVCPDWIFLNNSNVHVAKDRAWFKTYTPFNSELQHSIFISPGGTLPVLGIGSVEIPTKRSPNRSGVSNHSSINLKQVLHVPEFTCNVIGSPIFDEGEYDVQIDHRSASRGSIKDDKGRNIAYFDPNRPLLSLKLRNSPKGPPLGPHALHKDRLYMISCEWDAAQQQRWQTHQAQLNRLNHQVGFGSAGWAARAVKMNPPYTEAEKSFLKANFGGEYRFLVLHGLSIHKDEDREEGRQILRALISEDESEEETDDVDEDEDDDDDEDSEFDFVGHQADYHFSEKQLDWIETHYRHSEEFMYSHGLKFYDDEDVEEAKAIVDAMMDEDE